MRYSLTSSYPLILNRAEQKQKTSLARKVRCHHLPVIGYCSIQSFHTVTSEKNSLQHFYYYNAVFNHQSFPFFLNTDHRLPTTKWATNPLLTFRCGLNNSLVSSGQSFFHSLSNSRTVIQLFHVPPALEGSHVVHSFGSQCLASGADGTRSASDIERESSP